jgi:hypothetical protein
MDASPGSTPVIETCRLHVRPDGGVALDPARAHAECAVNLPGAYDRSNAQAGWCV